MDPDDKYMYRCLQLARKGAGHVAPNPMVGAVLVYNERIIGEGYHQVYGQAHAEVNCINSVLPEDVPLIQESTLYVSLEPCAHFGKTPPCADLIIRKQIRKVVVGCRDPFKEVDGKGIEKMKAAGIEVISNVLEEACTDLNKRFFTFHLFSRPYVILKWAQSSNCKISGGGSGRVFISNAWTNTLVHKWRSEEAAIAIGTNTALLDNPFLTTRLWPGRNPVRIVLDKKLSIPRSQNVYSSDARTVVFNEVKEGEDQHIRYVLMKPGKPLAELMLAGLYKLGIQSVIIEGGARFLQTFIQENLWDEARVITNNEMLIDDGSDAPIFSKGDLIHSETYLSDSIKIYQNRY
jgi:diaminohydroxyphosphoribosylaminopyrimidine deaminase/5-amino-6-(5-phosphoribosylamino)uracil reductase